MSETVKYEDCGRRKEFFVRLLSSFMFIPFIFMLFHVSGRVFTILCWITFAIMACEIFSPKIKGKLPLRGLALVVCFVGICSFVYCREFFGALGCGLLICMASFTDIGGYLFGKLIGGPKLCPKISPHKTWAGFWGGIIVANVAFFFLSWMFPDTLRYGGRLCQDLTNFWVVQAMILASIFGDLLESSFKRKISVKDMGDIFPGHGGILDRLDSLLLASTVLALLGLLF